MAKRCEICGKGPLVGMKISHSHRRTKMRQLPNLQRIKTIVKGAPARVRACTDCLKAGKVAPAA